jgi:FAD:protein FMN transferase
MMHRARPLLGTLVSIQVFSEMDVPLAERAVEEAFKVIAHIGDVMSAHHANSDLGRMSRALCGDVLRVDQHTVAVLNATRYWLQISSGAFNAFKAGATLASKGKRPGLSAEVHGSAEFDILSPTEVRMQGPVLVDLGGIAKGYAVDQGIEVLQKHGITQAVVNAGGDMRVIGEKRFSVSVLHSSERLRDQLFSRVRYLKNEAIATSVAIHPDTEFIPSANKTLPIWRNATVIAKDCMTADALTKWALQSSLMCPQLKIVMRKHGARMWRN